MPNFNLLAGLEVAKIYYSCGRVVGWSSGWVGWLDKLGIRLNSASTGVEFGPSWDWAWQNNPFKGKTNSFGWRVVLVQSNDNIRPKYIWPQCSLACLIFLSKQCSVLVCAMSCQHTFLQIYYFFYCLINVSRNNWNVTNISIQFAEFRIMRKKR